MGLKAPEPIDSHHILANFDCGKDHLNTWLQKTALRNHQNGSTRTQVVTLEDNTVVGFYSLSSGGIPRNGAPSKLKKNRPDPIPVFILARLAVDNAHQGQGIGLSLVRHAYEVSLLARKAVCSVCLITHVPDERIRDFYTKLGFQKFPGDSVTMFLPF